MPGAGDASIPAPITLEFTSFSLRPWRQADIDDLRTFADDPALVRWNPLARPDEPLESWLDQRCAWIDHCSWAVVTDTGRLAGSVSLFQFDWSNRSAQLGYWTAPLFRRRGYAAAAARAAADFAFSGLRVVRVAVYHAVENPESCGVATAAGFPLEGTTRKSWRYPDGRFHDEHVHARCVGDD